ncbi:MAG: hypothetical protein C0490_08170 [Marivirga sp.]|nr:hypothetical protein [Marivirga sp.]
MHEDLSKFLHGDRKRLFVNTELGCASGCSYCYLPSEGFKINASLGETKRLNFSTLFSALVKDPRFIPGENGTIISIGCFSECWDQRNRHDTQQLIINLLPYSNPIQLATKRQIRHTDLIPIVGAPSWRKQLKIFVSAATISFWHKWERGTTAPAKRFQTFESCADASVEAFLYIKPVIPGVTILDANKYGELMKQYGISAVVGDHFEAQGTAAESPISRTLYITPHSDVSELRHFLKIYGRVFGTSTEVLNKGDLRATQ